MDLNLDGEYIVDVYNDGQCAALGTQLFEVFAVKLNMNCQVYGKIHVKDGKRNLCYYDRQPEDVESTTQDGALLLSGPHRPSSAIHKIELLLDLKDKNGDELIKKSFPLCRVDEGKDDPELIDDLFDKYLYKEVVGKSGSAQIYYMLSRVAAQALVILTLVGENGDENGHFDVHGTAVARYANNYDKSATDDVKQHCSFVLFRKALEDKVQVKHNETIPLSRSCVVVPRCTSVVLELNLEFIHPNGFKEQLEDCKLEFQGCEDMSETKTINLKHGSMIIKLSWWHTFGSLGFIGAAID